MLTATRTHIDADESLIAVGRHVYDADSGKSVGTVKHHEVEPDVAKFDDEGHLATYSPTCLLIDDTIVAVFNKENSIGTGFAMDFRRGRILVGGSAGALLYSSGSAVKLETKANFTAVAIGPGSWIVLATSKGRIIVHNGEREVFSVPCLTPFPVVDLVLSGEELVYAGTKNMQIHTVDMKSRRTHCFRIGVPSTERESETVLVAMKGWSVEEILIVTDAEIRLWSRRTSHYLPGCRLALPGLIGECSLLGKRRDKLAFLDRLTGQLHVCIIDATFSRAAVHIKGWKSTAMAKIGSTRGYSHRNGAKGKGQQDRPVTFHEKIRSSGYLRPKVTQRCSKKHPEPCCMTEGHILKEGNTVFSEAGPVTGLLASRNKLLVSLSGNHRVKEYRILPQKTEVVFSSSFASHEKAIMSFDMEKSVLLTATESTLSVFCDGSSKAALTMQCRQGPCERVRLDGAVLITELHDRFLSASLVGELDLIFIALSTTVILLKFALDSSRKQDFEPKIKRHRWTSDIWVGDSASKISATCKSGFHLWFCNTKREVNYVSIGNKRIYRVLETPRVNRSMMLSRDEKHLLLGSKAYIAVYALTSLQCIFTLPADSNLWTFSSCPSLVEDLLVVGCSDGVLRFLDITSPFMAPGRRRVAGGQAILGLQQVSKCVLWVASGCQVSSVELDTGLSG